MPMRFGNDVKSPAEITFFFFSFFYNATYERTKEGWKMSFRQHKNCIPPLHFISNQLEGEKKKRVSKDIWLNPVPTCIVYRIRARWILFIRHSDARSHNQLTSVVLPLDYYVTGKKIPPTLFFPPIHLKHSTFQSLLLKEKVHSGQMGK